MDDFERETEGILVLRHSVLGSRWWREGLISRQHGDSKVVELDGFNNLCAGLVLVVNEDS